MTSELPAVLDRHPWRLDAALAAGVATVAAVSGIVLVAPGMEAGVPPTAIIVAWAIGMALPLLFRRRFPITVLLIEVANFAGYWATGQANEIASWLALGVAVYSAAAYGRRPRAGWVVVFVVVAVIANIAFGILPAGGPLVAVVAVALFDTLPYTLGWSLGTMTRRLRDVRGELEQRNVQLAQERDASTRRAILEERFRIARELHDVVAHHVSVMGVQAGVARKLFDKQPADAFEAISSVEASGRQAVADLHQLVGFLRHSGEQDDLGPQPTLAQLPDLVAQVRGAGLPVELTVEGDGAVPPAVELSAFRIVQEALTNTLKHATGATACVVVRLFGDTVEVDVVDDGGCGSRQPQGVGGKGLVGMRERVALHGGRVEAEPQPQGGFRVHAVLRGAS